MNINTISKFLLLLITLILLPSFTIYDPSPKTKKAIRLTGPIPVESGRVVQGLALLKKYSTKQRWVFTQDLDNGFNLFNVIDIYKDKTSKLVKSFKVKSDSHVQSVVKVDGKCLNGKSGYKLYTPGPKGYGMYLFCLEKSLAKLHKPKEKKVYIMNKNKKHKLKFYTMDFDFGGNRAVVMGKWFNHKYIFVLNLKDFLNKSVVRVVKKFPLSIGKSTLDQFIRTKAVQGLALSKITGRDRYVNIIVGYKEIEENKYLLKYDLNTGKRTKVRRVDSSMSFAKKEGKSREPEGLSYYKSTLFYTIATGLYKQRLTRLYAVPEKKF